MLEFSNFYTYATILFRIYELPRECSLTAELLTQYAIMENVIHNNNEINETPNLVSQMSNLDSAPVIPKMTEFEDSKPYISSGTQAISAHPTLGPPDADIKTFLSRPVKVYSGLSTAPGFLINPLKLFLNNPTVAAKTANYLAIRATVCVRYSESAMPFVYGCRQISAMPYFDPNDLRYIHPQGS